MSVIFFHVDGLLVHHPCLFFATSDGQQQKKWTIVFMTNKHMGPINCVHYIISLPITYDSVFYNLLFVFLSLSWCILISMYYFV